MLSLMHSNFHFDVFLESRTKMVTDIQKEIKKAYSIALKRDVLPYEQTNFSPNDDSSEEMLQVKQNFNSFFSTIVWFLEQDLFTNITMHLDVNFRQVKQGNFTAGNKKDINSALNKDKDNTFQNSQIYLLFYKKIKKSK